MWYTGRPFTSIKLLCEYGGASDTVKEGESALRHHIKRFRKNDSEVEWTSHSSGPVEIREDEIMHMTPLQIAIKCHANPSVMSTLLEHGANPRLLTEHERTSVIFTRSVKQIKETEHESQKGTALATLGRRRLRSIASLLGLSRQRQGMYFEPSRIHRGATSRATSLSMLEIRMRSENA